jgi:hypothetical protein
MAIIAADSISSLSKFKIFQIPRPSNFETAHPIIPTAAVKAERIVMPKPLGAPLRRVLNIVGLPKLIAALPA